jgi:fucokinase
VIAPAWDYLILTASNQAQERAYEGQLRLRRRVGLLPQAREAFVLADLKGMRIGSGGSTLACLAEVLNRERSGNADARAILERLRILIVHAGGDSRRLPAYGPCGKIFLPVPAGEGDLPPSLFDLLVPAFLRLPAPVSGRGQVVVTAGDALLLFDPAIVGFEHPGVTALTCYAAAEEASRHGVYCLGAGGVVRRFLQKPSPPRQQAEGAMNEAGRTPLDLGVMSLDAPSACALLNAFSVAPLPGGRFDFTPAARALLLQHGLDLYREICCAMGSGATLEHYIRSARSSGSTWPEAMLEAVYPALQAVPFFAHFLPECEFLHFGSTRQLAESGALLLERLGRPKPAGGNIVLNTAVQAPGAISGKDSWVEGCRVRSVLTLGGGNVVVGVDVDQPLSLPPGACLDVLSGNDRHGAPAWFVRCYAVSDTFKDTVQRGGTFCGRPLMEWLAIAEIEPARIWPDASEQSLWTARVFPAEPSPDGYRRWLWMYEPEKAPAEARRAYAAADRYSAAEIARLADQRAFHLRRLRISGGPHVLAHADLCYPEARP